MFMNIKFKKLLLTVAMFGVLSFLSSTVKASPEQMDLNTPETSASEQTDLKAPEETVASQGNILDTNQEITVSGTYKVTSPGRFEVIKKGKEYGQYPSVSKEGNGGHISFFNPSQKIGLTDYAYARVSPGEYNIKLYNEGTLRYVAESSSNFEQEDNNSLDKASPMQTNILYNGNLNYFDSRDYYKLQLNENGSLYLDVIRDSDNRDDVVFLYQEEEGGNVKEIYSIRHWHSEKIPKYRVSKGVYYLLLEKDWKNIEYQVKANFTPETSTAEKGFETEGNNKKETANSILPNIGYTGNIENEEDVDFFKVSVPKSGKAKLRMQTARQKANQLFKVELQKADGKTLDEISSSDNPLTVGNEVTLTNGDYFIKVSNNDRGDSHVDYTIQLVFDEVNLANKVEISSDKSEFYKGESGKLKLSVYPENATNKAVTWSSTDKAVVEVDAEGRITCKKTGSAIIRAALKDNTNIYGEFKVVVKKRLVDKIELTADKTELDIGMSTRVEAKISPSNADKKSIIWESSNPKVATVSDDGEVVALKAGKTAIKAISEDGSGVYGSITITVNRLERKDVNLKSLGISKGKLNKKFSPKRKKYKLTLTRNTESVKIKPVTSDKFASFTINGKKAKSITVKVGAKKSKTVKIVVTNDKAKKTYVIKIVRK